MRRPHSLSPVALEAMELLGLQIAAARRQRRWTAAELATRAGISVTTLRNLERGEPTVAAGIAFEVAALVGVPLFGDDGAVRRDKIANQREILALLPARIRRPERVDDDF